MTTFFLVRHAEHALGSETRATIAGRMPGVSLSEHGERQAEALAERLTRRPIRAVYAGPLERAQETAAPLAHALSLPVETSHMLDEVDYGDWTGRTLDSLEGDPLWRQYNLFRSGTRIPGGELASHVQARVVAELHRLREAHPHSAIAVFSHGDPLRYALCHYLGIPLDLWLRIEIDPASVTILEVADWGPRLLSLNDAPRAEPDP